jgi:hypothetical protein
VANKGDKPVAAEGVGFEDVAADHDEGLVLRLEDLLPDAAGEIVLYADATPVSVLSAAEMTAAGVAESHITAGGVDVTGLAFCAFDNGITLYYPGDLLLSVTPDIA